MPHAANVTNAREIAYDAFIRVMKDGVKPDDATEQLYEASKKPLKRLDRNFVKELLFGSLRWYSKIYWILQHTSKRDLDNTTWEIRTALIMGTYQIYYMDRVPDRSAVNESVNYIRKKSQANATSFVNGILRQIARRGEYFAKPSKTDKPADYLALQFAHPKWAVSRWLRQFNFDKLSVMLAANNQPPPNTIRINTMKTPVEDLHKLQNELIRDDRIKSDRRPLRSALRLKQFPDLSQNKRFKDGIFTIQDEASQLISFLVDPAEGEVIYDACAGPGGKLTAIFEKSEGKAAITAIEKDPDQMNLAKEVAERLGQEEITWVEEDFLDFKPKKKANKILLDAPCSGMGVLRRHPEGKWQKELSLVTSMAALQEKMIEHALGLLKKGGELIYSVCSFEKEETVDHLRWLNRKFGEDLEVISPVSRLPNYYKRYVTRRNVLLIYSGNTDDMDGFGSFIIKKVK